MYNRLIRREASTRGATIRHKLYSINPRKRRGEERVSDYYRFWKILTVAVSESDMILEY